MRREGGRRRRRRRRRGARTTSGKSKNPTQRCGEKGSQTTTCFQCLQQKEVENHVFAMFSAKGIRKTQAGREAAGGFEPGIRLVERR